MSERPVETALGDCPDEEELSLLIGGELATAALPRMDAHLDRCPACRELVVALARRATETLSDDPATGERPEHARATVRIGRGATIGRYLIVDALGSGGMGVVYAAYDPELDRKVALKLLRPGFAAGTLARARLQREAQAMARLSHPNVIAVHDVGTAGDQVFVAMDLVEGGTLGDWLRDAPRSWREVLDILGRAGRGLAAAHAAGLAHRDFKPANVLCGGDGSVRVTDFGLARPVGGGDDTPGETDAETGARASRWMTSLTVTGAVLGTPAYMAPEQLRGEAADAASDQFSFCVTLYETLYGARPYAGGSEQEIAASIAAETIAEPPAKARVPPWLRRVVLRGLRAAPAQRHPSMESLLAALSRDPGRWRRRLLAVVAAAACGAGIFALASRVARPESLCRGGEHRLAGAWDAARRDQVHAAFAGSHVPYAEAAWQRVSRTMDDYAAAWLAMHREACEATRVRGEQSDELLGRRMMCLDRRLDQLAALADLLAAPGAPVVDGSVRAAYALAPITECADAQALTALVRPPEDAAARARVDALSVELARVKARNDAGRSQEALEPARATAAKAHEIGYAPLEAAALFELAAAQAGLADFASAEGTLRDAAFAADRGGDDRLRAKAWSWMCFVVGFNLSRHQEGREYGRYAEAVIARLGGDDRLEALRLNELGTVAMGEGDFREALDLHRRALALLEKPKVAPASEPYLVIAHTGIGQALLQLGDLPGARLELAQVVTLVEEELGPDHPDYALALDNLSNVDMLLDRGDDALAAKRRALAIREAALGPDHAMVASSLTNLGALLFQMGRYDEALPIQERALAILLRVRGDDNRDSALAMSNLAETYLILGRNDEAEANARRALAIQRRLLGDKHIDTGASLSLVARSLALRGRYDEAIPMLREVVAIDEDALGPSHADIIDDLAELAAAQSGAGLHAEALASYERSAAIAEKEVGADSPYLVDPLIGLGGAQIAVGRRAQGLATLERAVAVAERTPDDPRTVAAARFALARALWDVHADRARARALAESARDLTTVAHDRDEIAAWLRAR